MSGATVAVRVVPALRPEPATARRRGRPRPHATPSRASPAGPVDSERWIGQRVFLGIGVVALLLAAGYLLKLSFERGWISPVMRCVGGVVAGSASARSAGGSAALPHLRRGTGRRRRRHHLPQRLGRLPPLRRAAVGDRHRRPGAGLGRAGDDRVRHRRRGARHHRRARRVLRAGAAGPEPGQRRLLLLYLASMAAGLGLVAARRRWRLTMLVVAASYSASAPPAPASTPALGRAALRRGRAARPASTSGSGSAGGRRGSSRSRVGGPCSSPPASGFLSTGPVLAAGLVLSAPVWWHGLRLSPAVPPPPGALQAEGAGWSAGEALYFFVTPVLLG